MSTSKKTNKSHKEELLKEIGAKREALASKLKTLAVSHRKLARSTPEARSIEDQMNEVQGHIRLLNRYALPLYRASQDDYKKSVFISYVGDSEGDDRLTKAKKAFGTADYTVRTGFERQREEFVVDNISDLISRSTVFLGVWTLPQAYVSPASDRAGKPAPGHWLPLELGMAIAHRMPFRIIVDHRIDSLWYLKPLQGFIHTRYDPSAPGGPPPQGKLGNFAWAIEEARIALDQRIEEQLFASAFRSSAEDVGPA